MFKLVILKALFLAYGLDIFHTLMIFFAFCSVILMIIYANILYSFMTTNLFSRHLI